MDGEIVQCAWVALECGVVVMVTLERMAGCDTSRWHAKVVALGDARLG